MYVGARVKACLPNGLHVYAHVMAIIPTPATSIECGEVVITQPGIPRVEVAFGGTSLILAGDKVRIA